MNIHAEAPDTPWSDTILPPLCAFGEDPETPHVCLPVAGLQYYDYNRLNDLLGRLRPSAGERLQMVRQPENPYDANAVELRWRNGQFQLGHLPRQIAAQISPLIDAGHAIRGYALNAGTGHSWSVWVVLLSPSLGDIGHLNL